MPPPSGSGMDAVPESWGEYRRLILTQLQSLQSELAILRKELEQFRQEEVSDIKIEIALLKLKSSIWGGFMGAVSAALLTAGAILLRLVH